VDPVRDVRHADYWFASQEFDFLAFDSVSLTQDARATLVPEPATLSLIGSVWLAWSAAGHGLSGSNPLSGYVNLPKIPRMGDNGQSYAVELFNGRIYPQSESLLQARKRTR
jgi:hypothetical protein